MSSAFSVDLIWPIRVPLRVLRAYAVTKSMARPPIGRLDEYDCSSLDLADRCVAHALRKYPSD